MAVFQIAEAAPIDAFPATRPLLEARGVTKRYGSGVLANDGIDLAARVGEVTAIVGPNGAGKTTLILQIVGLLRPTAGSIRIAGIDVVADPNAAKALIGYQPQSHMAMGGLEVRRVLPLTARLRGLSKSAAAARAAELVEDFDLESVVDTPLGTLSGGWRRLVDVAVAFAGDARLLVLDEPTEGLDPAHRRLIWRKLDRVRRTGRAACLLVTHNLLEVERVVDHVVMVDRSRVLDSGAPGVIKQRYAAHVVLDLYVRDGGVPAELAALGRARAVRPGHVQLELTREAVPRATALVFADGADGWLDDFRLAPPSLETILFPTHPQEP
jgi:ABC-type multidrug transport system ATPase subunit